MLKARTAVRENKTNRAKQLNQQPMTVAPAGKTVNTCIYSLQSSGCNNSENYTKVNAVCLLRNVYTSQTPILKMKHYLARSRRRRRSTIVAPRFHPYHHRPCPSPQFWTKCYHAAHRLEAQIRLRRKASRAQYKQCLSHASAAMKKRRRCRWHEDWQGEFGYSTCSTGWARPCHHRAYNDHIGRLPRNAPSRARTAQRIAEYMFYYCTEDSHQLRKKIEPG